MICQRRLGLPDSSAGGVGASLRLRNCRKINAMLTTMIAIPTTTHSHRCSFHQFTVSRVTQAMRMTEPTTVIHSENPCAVRCMLLKLIGTRPSR